MPPLDLSVWLYAASLFGSLLAGAFALHVKRDAATRREQLILESRLARIETRVEGLPDKGALHDLAISVTRVEGDMKSLVTHIGGIETGMRRIETVVNRQEDWLLNRGGPK